MDTEHEIDKATDSAKHAVKKVKGTVAQQLDELGKKPSSTAEEKVLHREGPVARFIETQTAKLPSDLFLLGGLAAIGASVILKATGKAKTANFVGEWVPTILILGLYNKLVKVAGSDRLPQGRRSGVAKAGLH